MRVMSLPAGRPAVETSVGFQSSFCQSDALVVSRVGDVNFSDGVKHCGSRPFTAVSRTNKMNIKFSAKRRSKGGRFTCSIGAKRMDPRTAETAAKSPQFCECGDQNKVRTRQPRPADTGSLLRFLMKTAIRMSTTTQCVYHNSVRL